MSRLAARGSPLSVPSSSGKMLLCAGRAAGGARTCRFQSPPHRGRCCCCVTTPPRAASSNAFSPLLIGEDAAVRLERLPDCAICAFSPLLIGEDAAVAAARTARRAIRNLSVPSSSGKMLLYRLLDVREAAAILFQSPPHRGRCCCQPPTEDTRAPVGLSVPSSSGKMLLSVARSPPKPGRSPFSPLLIGEDAAVTATARASSRRSRLSVPSSSGKMLLSAWLAEGTPPASPFSPLLIGEDAAVTWTDVSSP